MDIQEIEIKIGKNGQVQVQVRGAKGKACLELTRDLEATLGGELEREFTSEAVEETGNPLSQSLQIKSGS